MQTITVTAATLVAAVGSVELDELVPVPVQLRSYSTQFPACRSARILNFSAGTRQCYKLQSRWAYACAYAAGALL